METEVIDKLFLELSQFSKAKTAEMLRLESELKDTKRQLTHADNMIEKQRKTIAELRHSISYISK